FVNGSKVRVNGSDRTTTFGSSMQLTAALTAADIAAAGTLSVTVFNPTPGGGLSNAVGLTVNAAPAQRTLRVLPGNASQGGTATVRIELEAQGDENALQFSLDF